MDNHPMGWRHLYETPLGMICLHEKEMMYLLPFPVLPKDPLRRRWRALSVLRHGRVPAAAVAAAPCGRPTHEVGGDGTVFG